MNKQTIQFKFNIFMSWNLLMRFKFFSLSQVCTEVLIKQMGSAYFCVVSTVLQHIIPFKTVT